MSGNVTMRPVALPDFAQVYALLKKLVGNTDVIAGTGGEQRIGAILIHPGTTMLAAEIDGQLVSMATLHVRPNMTFGGRPYALIENVVTLKSHRGQGLSRAVM
ncbi:MAG: hypothetical protein ACI8R4_001399 [Paracoccaceae bacterium]|jgi:hypothetical protein